MNIDDMTTRLYGMADVGEQFLAETESLAAGIREGDLWKMRMDVQRYFEHAPVLLAKIVELIRICHADARELQQFYVDLEPQLDQFTRPALREREDDDGLILLDVDGE